MNVSEFPFKENMAVVVVHLLHDTLAVWSWKKLLFNKLGFKIFSTWSQLNTEYTVL